MQLLETVMRPQTVDGRGEGTRVPVDDPSCFFFLRTRPFVTTKEYQTWSLISEVWLNSDHENYFCTTKTGHGPCLHGLTKTT
jgi:hypothetical protein